MLNHAATEAAYAKQCLIKDKFEEWIFKEPQRRQVLVSLYNSKFNCIRPREYDGSNLRFPGMNPEITLRPHQRKCCSGWAESCSSLLVVCMIYTTDWRNLLYEKMSVIHSFSYGVTLRLRAADR